MDALLGGMVEVLDYAERRTRARIAAFPDGTYHAGDVLVISRRGEPRDLSMEVAVTIRADELEVDFAGTDAQSPGNLNCPLAVTKSAVYYVLRVLTDPDIPSSAGAYRPVRVTPRRLPGQRPAARGRRGRQRGDVEPDRRRRHGGFRPGGPGAGRAGRER